MKEYWVNVYYHNGIIYGNAKHSSRAIADNWSTNSIWQLAYRIHVRLK